MNFDKQLYLANIEKFSNAAGVSGHESYIADLLRQSFLKEGLHVSYDSLGGIYASNVDISKKTDKKRIFISAHMDEVGFLAKEITANGLVKPIAVGGIVNASLFGIRVAFLGDKGKHIGVFTAVPSHFAATNSVGADDLTIDFGFETEEEARAAGMTEGTVITFDSTFTATANAHRYMGKAIDNRYGCAMVATLASSIFSDAFKNNDVEIVIGATVMEEIGLKGAQAAINMVQPDFVIVLDCSPAADTLPKDNKNGRLGAGVLYRYIDRTMVLSERLKKYLKIILKEFNIPHQQYVSAGGTDAGRIIEQGIGIPTITCCIPSRYIHNSSAIFDMRDVEAAYKTIWHLSVNYLKDIHNYLHYINEE